MPSPSFPFFTTNPTFTAAIITHHTNIHIDKSSSTISGHPRHAIHHSHSPVQALSTSASQHSQTPTPLRLAISVKHPAYLYGVAACNSSPLRWNPPRGQAVLTPNILVSFYMCPHNSKIAAFVLGFDILVSNAETPPRSVVRFNDVVLMCVNTDIGHVDVRFLTPF